MGDDFDVPVPPCGCHNVVGRVWRSECRLIYKWLCVLDGERRPWEAEMVSLLAISMICDCKVSIAMARAGCGGKGLPVDGGAD